MIKKFKQFIYSLFKKNPIDDCSLEIYVKQGVLTKEEMLYLLKERAVEKWKREMKKSMFKK